MNSLFWIKQRVARRIMTFIRNVCVPCAVRIVLSSGIERNIQALVQTWRNEVISSCERSINDVRVLTVADKLRNGWHGSKKTIYSLCSLAKSLQKASGLKLGVLGLTHVGHRGCRRAASYMQWIFGHYLKQPIPPIPPTRGLLGQWHALSNLLLLDHLQHVDNDSLVLYVDAFDVLVQSNIDALRRTYCEKQWSVKLHGILEKQVRPEIVNKTTFPVINSYPSNMSVRQPWVNERILFAAEENCYPFPNYWSHTYPDYWGRPTDPYRIEKVSKRIFRIGKRRKISGDELCYEQERLASGERRFLNSGGALGRAAHLREFTRLAIRTLRESEMHLQASWQVTWLRYPHLGMLDHDGGVFLQLHSPERGAATQVKDLCQRMPVRIGERTPFILHFNGNGKMKYSNCRLKLVGGYDPQHCRYVINLDTLWNRSKARRLLNTAMQSVPR